MFLQQKEQKATSRTLGILQGKASFHIKENFEMTEEVLLKGGHMGQYLAVGLITKIEIAKQYELLDLQEAMQQTFYFTPELYEVSETEQAYFWTLKPKILQEELIAFLEKIYPFLYKRTAFYQDILDTLKSVSANQWMALAEEKSFYAFQLSESEIKSISYENIRSTLYYESIILALEGKILMEGGNLFNFLTYTLQKAFEAFKLSGALNLYIT